MMMSVSSAIVRDRDSLVEKLSSVDITVERFYRLLFRRNERLQYEERVERQP